MYNGVRFVVDKGIVEVLQALYYSPLVLVFAKATVRNSFFVLIDGPVAVRCPCCIPSVAAIPIKEVWNLPFSIDAPATVAYALVRE